MPRANPIYMRLQQDRGQSRTVIGAICRSWPLMKYQVADKTNAASFCAFLQHIAREVESVENMVIVLDNHAAHRGKRARKLCQRLGINLEFLPPAASELNPIERMWSYFKHEWRLLISDDNYRLNRGNIDRYLTECLDKVARHGTRLAEGPMNEIVLALPESAPA